MKKEEFEELLKEKHCIEKVRTMLLNIKDSDKIEWNSNSINPFDSKRYVYTLCISALNDIIKKNRGYTNGRLMNSAELTLRNIFKEFGKYMVNNVDDGIFKEEEPVKKLNRKEYIKLQCEIAYQEKFLELIGKKVGDKVLCNFSVNFGNHTDCSQSLVESEGTISYDETGYFVLSDKEMRVAHSEYDKPNSSTCFKTHWVYEMKRQRSRLDHIILEDED